MPAKSKKEEDNCAARTYISTEMDKAKRHIVFYNKQLEDTKEKLRALELLQVMAWRDEK